MSKRELPLDKDVCHFTEYKERGSSGLQKIEYVKGCNNGRKCIKITNSEDDFEIHKCQEEKQLPLLKLGEKTCNFSIECDQGLTCLKGICTIDVDSTNPLPYFKGNYYYCPSDYIPAKYSNENAFQCKKKSTFSHTSKCYVYDSNNNIEYEYAPNLREVCGKINTDTISNILYIKDIESNKIGSQDAGTFVQNMEACKSGYAMKFCLNGDYVCPSAGLSTTRELKCVDIIDIEISNRCVIKGNDGSGERTFRVSNNPLDCLKLQVKKDMFEKYLDKMSKCDDVENYDDEPLTCRNKDLRKYYYFYQNPIDYILYKDQDQVIDFLVQQGTSSSSFIDGKVLVLMLLSLFL